MTVPDILKSPVRVYPDRVGVYCFDGRIHCDILGPAGPERDAVLALVGQAQNFAKLALRFKERLENNGLSAGSIEDHEACEKVLRDAGVVDE